MRLRRVASWLVWPAGLALVAGLIAAVYAVREAVVARREAEEKGDEPPPKRVLPCRNQARRSRRCHKDLSPNSGSRLMCRAWR